MANPCAAEAVIEFVFVLWLMNGQAVRWETAAGPMVAMRLDDNGETLITDIQVNRRSLVNGLFHGVEGMRIGGTRRLEISAAPRVRRSRRFRRDSYQCRARCRNHNS